MERGSERARYAWLAGLLALAAGCDVRDELTTPPRSHRRPVTDVDGRSFSAASAGQSQAIEYVAGYESGLRRAAKDRRPLVLVCLGSWCRWSGELAQRTLADPRIVDLSRGFVCVTIDADRDAATCRRFGVDRFPTVLLLDASGTERFRVAGSTADGLAEAMAALLDANRGRMASGVEPRPR